MLFWVHSLEKEIEICNRLKKRALIQHSILLMIIISLESFYNSHPGKLNSLCVLSLNQENKG